MTDDEDLVHTENTRLRKLLAQAGVDAAASDVADKLQKLLIAELHHRVKNLLAMVLSITTHTINTASTLEAANEAIRNRIMILARSFDLLARGNADAAPLKSVIENAIDTYNETESITVSVPRLRVGALPAISLALIVNELSTNAVKYGALSTRDGRVEVTGTLDADNLSLLWTEKNGPPCKPLVSQRFGTRMIRSVIPDAKVDLDFKPSGLMCGFVFPLASLRA